MKQNSVNKNKRPTESRAKKKGVGNYSVMKEKTTIGGQTETE